MVSMLLCRLAGALGACASGRRTGRAAWLSILLSSAALAACAPLTPLDRPAFADPSTRAEHGALAVHAAAAEGALGDGESAFWLLEDNADSLRVRIALAELAEETLDIQYFIWQDDMTGRLLMKHVLDAADRGVRVRFLIDDLAVVGRHAELESLDAHPRIEVRVFNPWRLRSPLIRPFEFVTRMNVLNHRMHNKVLVADGRFAILGGRNIGDRYFGVYDNFVQNDVDLMLAGALVGDAMASFETYWISENSRPVGGAGDASTIRALCEESVAANAEMLVAFATPPDGWNAYFAALVEKATKGRGRLLLDPPNVDEQSPTALYEHFKAMIAEAREDLIISSPYLVPDSELIELIADLVERGVRVRILTNSLASNSHVIAHSAYKKWRRALLAAGAEIYEMRSDAEVLERYKTPPAEPKWLALHTKAVVVDGRTSFVGSPNVDPRSMILNTEIGVIADDPELAAALVRLLERDMAPANSWRVTLENGGWLKWWNGDERVDRQPAKGFQQRAVEFFLNLLPIKNQA